MKANYNPKEEKKVSGDLKMSLYELNKSAILQLPSYSEDNFKNAIDLINNFVGNDKFYMLLGKEISYYTVFMREPSMTETIGEAVIDCLRCFDNVKSIETTEDRNAIEIWVTATDNPTVMYLFPYNEGVIICR